MSLTDLHSFTRAPHYVFRAGMQVSVYSIELVSRGYAIEYTVCDVAETHKTALFVLISERL